MSQSRWLISGLITLIVSLNCVSCIDVAGDIINERVAAGGHVAHDLTISLKPSEEPLYFSIYVNGMSMSPEGTPKAIAANDDDYIYSARSFLTVSPVSFMIQPGESKKILLEGDIPNDVGSGTRYAMLQIKSRPIKANQSSSGSEIVGGINLPIIIEISETDQIRSGEISELELKKPISFVQQDLSITFENTGNTHFKAMAKADLLDESKEVFTSISTPLTIASVFPGIPRHFSLSIPSDDELKSGKYSINASVCLADETVLASKVLEFEI